MKFRCPRVVGAWAILLVVEGGSVHAQDVTSELLQDASTFWLGSGTAPQSASVRLRRSDASFDGLYGALKATPMFSADVPTGRLDRSRSGLDGLEYPYTVLIPDDYDPGTSYPVLVYLHGGVNREARTGGTWWSDYDRIADPDRIVIVPAAWRDATWWQASQSENLMAILREVGRVYHIDTDRVHLIGISDGGTGAYFQAFRSQTSWASFLPFIGHPAVLSSPRLQVDGQMHVANLRNRPFLIVNSGQDRLYPTASVDPFIEMFRENGVEVVYRPQPNAGHDLTWLPAESARIDSFIVATKRDALPDVLEWETEDVGQGRFAWVEIEELGHVDGESSLTRRNSMRFPGVRETRPAFPDREPSGRAEVARDGNHVVIRTSGVRRLRLLISPEEFDLASPIRVDVNGASRFEGLVGASPDVLLDRAAADRDRSMLFAAEIEIDLEG